MLDAISLHQTLFWSLYRAQNAINPCFEQCLALDFIVKTAVIMWLWAALRLAITNFFGGLFLFKLWIFLEGTHVRPYTQSRQAESMVKRLRFNRNWFLTGLFSSNQAVQIQLSVSLKRFGVPKYVPQCNWHRAQAHTWAVGYL